jgi:hypothetical protein
MEKLFNKFKKPMGDPGGDPDHDMILCFKQSHGPYQVSMGAANDKGKKTPSRDEDEDDNDEDGDDNKIAWLAWQ